jgi:hypothetical protein
VARAANRATNDQGGSRRTGQQDAPDGLGIDDTRRALQGAGHRIKRDKASGRRRGWKWRIGANAQSRLKPPDQENSLGPCTSSASFRSGPEPREWHYGRRHMKGRTYRSDTWPHQPATAKALRKALANGGPSIHGPIIAVCNSRVLAAPRTVTTELRPPLRYGADSSHEQAQRGIP